MGIDFSLGDTYSSFSTYLSSTGILTNTIFKLSVFTIVILIYSLFVFYSYKLFSRKNLFSFNFKGYLDVNHPTASSFLGFFVYLLEYAIILPLFVFAWFTFYSVFLLILAKSLDVQTILLVSTALIASIRISSFASQNLSQDLAKMLPFTLLALAIMGDKFFTIDTLLERVYQIPSLISSFPIYLLFILSVEFILRFFDALRIFILRRR